MCFSFQCFLSSGRPCPVILSGAKDPGCRTVGCVCIRKNLSRHSEHVLLHPGFFSAARFRMTEKGVILSVSDTPPGHARIPSVSPPRSADSRRWPVTPRTCVRPVGIPSVSLCRYERCALFLPQLAAGDTSLHTRLGRCMQSRLPTRRGRVDNFSTSLCQYKCCALFLPQLAAHLSPLRRCSALCPQFERNLTGNTR